MIEAEWVNCAEIQKMLLSPLISLHKLRLWVEACRDATDDLDTDMFDLDTERGLSEAVRAWSLPNAPISAPTRCNLLRDIVENPFRPVVDYATCEKCGNYFVPDKPRFYRCPHCGSDGSFTRSRLPQTWLTPQVIALATAAYECRVERDCKSCGSRRCSQCKGTGRVSSGQLDPDRLAVLADALEEAGMEDEQFSKQVRCGGEVEGMGNKGLGYYAYWKCLRCGNECLIPSLEEDGRCHVMKPVTKRRLHPILAHLRSPAIHYRGMWSLDLLLEKA
jgi:hypothetical protein